MLSILAGLRVTASWHWHSLGLVTGEWKPTNMSSSKTGKFPLLEGVCLEPKLLPTEGTQPQMYWCCGLRSPASAFLVSPSFSHPGSVVSHPQVWDRRESSCYTHIHEEFVMPWGNVPNAILIRKLYISSEVHHVKQIRVLVFESVEEIHQKY